MAYDSAATKARIISAATTEFATHGLAGARVDRIAASADANKQLIYAYFGSKEALFDAVIVAHLGQLLDGVPFDASDLPRYAEQLAAFEAANPELSQLGRWHSLERPGHLLQLPQVVASMAKKVVALAEAQAAGTISDELPAHQLLAVLLAMIHGGSLFSGPESDPIAEEQQREALAIAVRRLVTPQR
jgi:AcrR family transcriptional regulator